MGLRAAWVRATAAPGSGWFANKGRCLESLPRSAPGCIMLMISTWLDHDWIMMMISTGLDHPVSQQKNRLAGPPLHTRDSRVCITNKQKNVACKGKRGGLRHSGWSVPKKQRKNACFAAETAERQNPRDGGFLVSLCLSCFWALGLVPVSPRRGRAARGRAARAGRFAARRAGLGKRILRP